MRANPTDQTGAAGTVRQPTMEIVRRAQLGDQAAFEQLYRAHVDRVHGLCLRMCADRRRAEELTQDAFVRAWQNMRSFRGRSRFSTWLHRIAVNVVIEAMRTEKRGRERHLSVLREGGWQSGSHPAVHPPDGPVDARIDLERAIAMLPPGARTVLVLRDIEGMKYEEVADATGLALGTVKAQLYRARRLLRDRLDR